MQWRPFYALLVTIGLILPPGTAWSIEISETELARLQEILQEAKAQVAQLRMDLSASQQALNESMDSWMRLDVSWRAYESAATAAIRAVLVERDAAWVWAAVGWIGTAIAAGAAVLAILIR